MQRRTCLIVILIAAITISISMFYRLPQRIGILISRKEIKTKICILMSTAAKQETFTYKVYKPRNWKNEARETNTKECIPSRAKSSMTGYGVILVTNFINLNLNKYQKDLEIYGENKINKAMIEARLMEILNVLQSNLNSYLVQEIYVFVNEKETAMYLQHLPLQNSDKLVIVVANEDIPLQVQFLFISSCLTGKLVAMTNQDNNLDNYWESRGSWPQILRRKRIMYALTRHSSETPNCSWSNLPSSCEDGRTYLGSHDTFLFHVKIRWTVESLDQIKGITSNMPFMENRIISMFRTKFNYTVLNPCKVLRVYHNHCVPIREKGRGSKFLEPQEIGREQFSYHLDNR